MARARAGGRASFWTPGEGLAWVAALVFTLSSFMGWYSGSLAGSAVEGLTVSVLAWHTGVLGKLVFFVGLTVLVLLVLRASGFDLPPAGSAGAVIAVLGAIGTILVVVRLIDIADDDIGLGRSIGIWISLGAGCLLIVAGLLKAAEEA